VTSPGKLATENCTALGGQRSWLSDDHVLSIDIHVLDHTLGYYRLHRTLTPEQETSTIDVPIRIQINWNRLAHLIRQ
jgi:hypothetical protein